MWNNTTTEEANCTLPVDFVPMDDSNVTDCSQLVGSRLARFAFITEGVLLMCIALVGILANCVSIAVLTRRTMKTQVPHTIV